MNGPTLSPRATAARVRLVVAVASAVCFGSGLVLSSIGPALPDFASRTGRSLAELGGVFVAIFLGALVAQGITGLWADRAGVRPLLLAGIALYGSGIIALGTASTLVTLLVAGTVAGLGWGLAGLTTNVLAAQIAHRRRTVVLNLINFCYAVGGILGPLLVALALRRYGRAGLAVQLGGLIVLLTLPLAWLLVPSGRQIDHSSSGGSVSRWHHAPALWLFGALAFLYVGIENAVAGWTTAYLMQTIGYDAAQAAARTSWFWVAFCVGRLVATGVGLAASAAMMLRCGLALGCAATALLVFGVNQTGPTFVALVLLGLSFGPVYASLVELVTAAFPHRPATALSVVSALAGLGGMLLPWWHGLVLERAGGRAMAWTVAIVAVAMWLSAEGAQRATSRGHWGDS